MGSDHAAIAQGGVSVQNTYFITATGTEIGKTFVTCALTHQAREAGKTVQALKPVISGFSEDTLAESDTGQLLAAQGLWQDVHFASTLSPWRFKAPLSPDMAAAKEGSHVPFEELVQWCKERSEADGMTLIEGVGGVMVPLSKQHTVLDWAKALNAPVILVTGSYLGSLSHTLTAVSVLKQHGLPIHAIIINESDGATVTLPDTYASLRMHVETEVPIIALPRCTDWRAAPPLLQELRLV